MTVPEHCLLFTFTRSFGALNPCCLLLRILCLSWVIVGWHVLLTRDVKSCQIRHPEVRIRYPDTSEGSHRIYETMFAWYITIYKTIL